MYRKIIIKIVVTILLLAFLAYRVDLREIGVTIGNIRWLPYIGSYLILLLCSIPLAIRLQILMQPTVLDFHLKRLIEVQFISKFYSVLFPTGIGISIARWYKITQNRVGRRVFIVITIVERVMTAMTLLLSVGIPLLFAGDPSIQPFRSSVLPIIFLLVFICILFFLILLYPYAYGIYAMLMKRVESKFRSDLAGKIVGVYEDFGLYLHRKHLIRKAFAAHLVYQGMSFIYFFLLFMALRLELPWVTILWISMLVMLILTLPISIGGLGVRESGFALLLGFYGIDPEKGVVLGGLIFIHLILNVVLGAILNLIENDYSIKQQPGGSKREEASQ